MKTINHAVGKIQSPQIGQRGKTVGNFGKEIGGKIKGMQRLCQRGQAVSCNEGQAVFSETEVTQETPLGCRDNAQSEEIGCAVPRCARMNTRSRAAGLASELGSATTWGMAVTIGRVVSRAWGSGWRNALLSKSRCLFAV